MSAQGQGLLTAFVAFMQPVIHASQAAVPVGMVLSLSAKHT